jgi:hypothetical protein
MSVALLAVLMLPHLPAHLVNLAILASPLPKHGCTIQTLRARGKQAGKAADRCLAACQPASKLLPVRIGLQLGVGAKPLADSAPRTCARPCRNALSAYSRWPWLRSPCTTAADSGRSRLRRGGGGQAGRQAGRQARRMATGKSDSQTGCASTHSSPHAWLDTRFGK